MLTQKLLEGLQRCLTSPQQMRYESLTRQDIAVLIYGVFHDIHIQFARRENTNLSETCTIE
jgi:hypothetical protein